jgi:hypothetical protein
MRTEGRRNEQINKSSNIILFNAEMVFEAGIAISPDVGTTAGSASGVAKLTEFRSCERQH